MGMKKLNSVVVLIAGWALVPSAVLVSSVGSSHLQGHDSQTAWRSETRDLPNRLVAVRTNTKQNFSASSDPQIVTIAVEIASLLAQ